MKKKKKLTLDLLKVESFVTSMEEDVLRHIQGGLGEIEEGGGTCPNNGVGCQPCYSSC